VELTVAPAERKRGGVRGRIRERAFRTAFPLHAIWEVTYRCPWSCRHCLLNGRADSHRSMGRGASPELDTRGSLRALEEMARLGVLFVLFTGGEPLERPDFFELVDEARRLGFAWKLYTCGAHVDERRADMIAERAPLGVGVSLHGLARAHEALTRTPGSFDKALGAIERLARREVPVTAKMSVTPDGLRDLAELRHALGEHGVELRASGRMYPDAAGRPVSGDMLLSTPELAECLSLCEMELPMPDASEVADPESPVCGAGRVAVALSPTGDVRPCNALREVAGNIRNSALSELWESPAMRRARSWTNADRSGCRDCGDAAYCFFCPGLAEAETGDPLAPSPTLCREARARRALREGG
jgi:radical SAM protein with 4Fe4S-binding SPASM domain